MFNLKNDPRIALCRTNWDVSTCFRFDYTDSTFSPPADDFFFVRYPKHQDAATSGASNDKEGFRSLSEFVGSKTESAVAKSSNFLPSQNSGKSVANIDFSKHPLPCQRYIPFIADKGD